MSDFGSHVAAYRTDRRELSEDDERLIQKAARSLQFAAKDRIGPYDEFDLRFGGARNVDGVEGTAVLLSGYFVEDDNDACRSLA